MFYLNRTSYLQTMPVEQRLPIINIKMLDRLENEWDKNPNKQRKSIFTGMIFPLEPI